MPKIPMAGDPNFERIADMREGRAMLERRACQYAAWIADRDGLLHDQAGAYNARFDGEATVTLATYGADAHALQIRIPAHVLAFDPTAPALALPARADQAEPAPRCEHTAPLALEPPAAQAPAPLAEVSATSVPANRKSRPRSSKATRKAAREFEESRAMRAARIASLPLSSRRQIGAR